MANKLFEKHDHGRPGHGDQGDARQVKLLEGILKVLKSAEVNNQQRHSELLAKLTVPRSRVTFGFAVGQPQQKVKKRMPLSLKITNEQKVKVTLKPVTDAGKPVNVDGAPEWSVVAGESTLVVAEDGLSADLVSAETPGDTQVLVTADADLGEGVEQLSDTIDLNVIGAAAKNLGLAAEAPVPK